MKEIKKEHITKYIDSPRYIVEHDIGSSYCINWRQIEYDGPGWYSLDLYTYYKGTFPTTSRIRIIERNDTGDIK